MWELNYQESWAWKNWGFRTVVLEKTLESPLDCKEIQPVHPKGNHSWVFIGRTDAEAETPILWPHYVKSWLIWKDPDVGKDWRQEEKGMTEDEMVGWRHWLNGDEFGWTLGVGDGQGGLVCCGSWGNKELDMTEWLNWTEPQSLGFPNGSVGKEFTCSAGKAGDSGSILGSGRSPRGGNSNPLQYSCLGYPMDIGAWQARPMWSQRAGHHSTLAHVTIFNSIQWRKILWWPFFHPPIYPSLH